MNKTKIEWCDYTWNPVTGCLHNCPYCYARGIARRFDGHHYGEKHAIIATACNDYEKGSIYYLETPYHKTMKNKKTIAPYPFSFYPIFHKYRLDDPQRIKKPSTVFVCSMADLFGEWVPDEWIQKVFAACEKAPQHRYLFLTKNPGRYIELEKIGKLPEHDNFWYGTTITTDGALLFYSNGHNTFVSIEPIAGEFKSDGNMVVDWVIIGTETGNRKGKIIPKREWIENIVDTCRDKEVPVFMKNNLCSVWGEELIQQFPWGRK